MLGDVVEEFALDPERPAGECTSTSPCARMSSIRSVNRCVTCAGSDGRGDGDDRLGLRDLPGGGEEAAPPRLWPISSAGACAGVAQMVGGADQIGDVGREGGVGEFAFAGAEPGEVEAQHGDALGRQRVGDALAASASLPQVKQCANSA